MRTILQIVGTLAGGLAVLYGTLYYLFDGQSTGRVVLIVMGGIAVLVAGILLTLAIVRLSMDRRARTAAAAETPAPIIDAQYRTLTDYQPPHPQLPQPRVITVPRYTSNGAAMPYNMPAQPVPILRTMADDVELSVPLNYLQRFLGLQTPARSEWTGKREMYSACLAFAEAHGLLDRDARGGATWRACYPLDQRRAWSKQFETYPTGGGVDPGAIGQR